MDFPSRCNCGIIASEDISTLRLPFNPNSIYFPIFDTYRLNSFYRMISLCARVCVFRPSSVPSPPLNTFRIFLEESISLLILRGDHETYIERLFSSFSNWMYATRRKVVWGKFKKCSYYFSRDSFMSCLSISFFVYFQ